MITGFDKLKKVLKFIRNGLIIVLLYIFRIFPINNNKIVISNYYGKGYGDNGKYIVEEIERQRLNFDIIWLCKSLDYQMPQRVKKVKYNSMMALWEIATAKIWIDNCRKPHFFRKRKGQYYVQTWHGSIPLKKIEKDVEDKLSSTYVQNAKHDSMMADLFISNSSFCTEMYRSSFWYDGEILECGSPRCDILINGNDEIVEKVKKHFDVDENCRILIYAPTFRVDYTTEVYDINFDKLIKVIQNKLGGKWKVLVRLHPNISNKDNFMEYNSEIINATDYDDMYELLVASDILITDYSSTMFEFSFTKKPVFLYAPDIDSYTKDRDFYFDIWSLPYPIAENNEQLINRIEQFDLNKYLKDLNIFMLNLGIKEKGNASYQVVERIKQIIICE